MIVAEDAYDIAETTIDSHVVKMKSLGNGVMRIRLRGDVYDLHQACADSYIIKMGWTDDGPF